LPVEEEPVMRSIILAAVLSGAAAISPAGAYAPYEATFAERLERLQELSFTLLAEEPLTSGATPLAFLDREVRLRVDVQTETCVDGMSGATHSPRAGQGLVLSPGR
jgi:hypothetical protein